jgi:hypothetical protein
VRANDSLLVLQPVARADLDDLDDIFRGGLRVLGAREPRKADGRAEE